MSSKLMGDLLRSIRRPTKLDELSKSVSKPKGAIPKFGLPKWKLMPLDSKLPLVPGPKGAYYFTCKKLGQQLYGCKNNEFNLTDPYNNEINFYAYNSLHDRHLANYFNKENKIKYLIERGFISDNLDVVCTIKEYNMYRKYLKKVHGDEIKKEINRRDEITRDRRVLERAEVEAKKNIARFKMREQKNKMRSKILRDTKRRERKKIREIKLREIRREKKVKEVEERKKERLREIVLRSRIRSERIRQKRAVQTQKFKKKLVDILWKRIRRDRRRKKLRRERIKKETELKLKEIQDKWQQRYEFQKYQIIKEKLALALDRKRRELSINNYNKKINDERQRIEEESKKYSEVLKYQSGCKKKHKTSGKPQIKKRIMNKNNHPDGNFINSGSCLMTDKCKC